jgi:hypothetical protein
MGEKRCRAFGRGFVHLHIKVFGNLLHGEEDRKNHAEVAFAEDNFIGGDFKTIGPRQASAGEGRTLGGPTDLAEPMAPQALI